MSRPDVRPFSPTTKPVFFTAPPPYIASSSRLCLEDIVIACIGWGSLIWCQKRLPIEGAWRSDGPELPIEFARESSGQRITLVICEGAPPVTALWAVLNVATLDEARQALAAREGIRDRNIGYSIGYWNAADASDHREAGMVGRWAAQHDLESVVWTALKPKIGDAYRTPEVDEVIEHLRGLDGNARDAAEEYVRLAPRQIVTPYRRAIEDALGWTPLGLI